MNNILIIGGSRRLGRVFFPFSCRVLAGVATTANDQVLVFRVLVNGVKTQLLKDRDTEKARIAEDKRKQEEHERIISGAGGFPPVVNTQSSSVFSHWQNISRKSTPRPATCTSVAHFRPGSNASTGTGTGPFHPLTQRESLDTIAQYSSTNFEPGSQSSKALVMSKLTGFKNIAERWKASNQTKSVNLPSLKLMSGVLGEGAGNITEAKKKPKKKKKKTKKK